MADRSGMPPSTLRYYEREQIIESTARKGLRRQYPAGVLDTLAVVALCRSAGFSLSEIKALIATGGDPTWKQLATRKRNELRSQIGRLTTIADQLDHAMECPSPNVFECPHFQAVLHDTLPVTTRTGVADISR